MAISLVGTNTQDTGSGNALTFAVPGAAQADDLILVAVKQSDNGAAGIWDDDGGGGRGYTQLAYNRSTGGRDQETAIYFKVHSGSESNPTFTWRLGVTGEPMSGAMLIYRGVDTSDPIANFGFLNGQNNAAPANPTANISGPSQVVVVHAATHDDIVSPQPPTDFTMRAQVWAGTSNDHRNLFVADKFVGDLGFYSPGAWNHTVSSTTPEFHTYTLVLSELQSVGFTNIPSGNEFGTSVTVEGFDFGSVQGSGKIELWSDPTGTIKVNQTVTSWSDTSVSFLAVQGTLSNNTTLYVVLTNNAGDETFATAIIFGIPSYTQLVTQLAPDHYWTFNNNYIDVINGNTINLNVQGSGNFVTQPIAENSPVSWLSLGGRRGPDNSSVMNTATTVNGVRAGWIRVNTLPKPLTCIYEEGGGVNNLAFFLGMGNKLIAQLADTNDDNVQVFSDFALVVGRSYHILLRFSYDGSEPVNELALYIDGIKQQVSAGNPLTATNLDAHPGAITFGGTGGNLEVGGTNVDFLEQENTNFSNWVSFSTNKSATELYPLFARGAIPEVTFPESTVASLQSQLDAYSDQTFQNVGPLALRISGATTIADLTLTANDIVFDEAISLFLEWRGLSQLTIINKGTSNFRAEKCIVTSTLGSIVIIDAPLLTLTGIQAGSEVRVYDSSTNQELAGSESVTGTFTASLESTTVNIVVVSVQYEYLRIEDVVLNQDLTLPILQQFDRNYSNE